MAEVDQETVCRKSGKVFTPETAEQNLKPFISVLCAFIPEVMQNIITVFACQYQFEGDSFSCGWLQGKLVKEEFNKCDG